MNDDRIDGRPNCASCPHFMPAPAGPGHCRRYPPTMFVHGQKNPLTQEMEATPGGFWPPVLHNHFCGEHPEFGFWMGRYLARQAAGN